MGGDKKAGGAKSSVIGKQKSKNDGGTEKQHKSFQENKDQRLAPETCHVIRETEDVAVCAGTPGSTCGLQVGEEDEGVECDICQKWYHTSCQGISSDAYAALQEHSETLAWICKECKAKTKENKGCVLNCSSIGSKLNSLTESIESKLSCLAETIKDQDRIIRKSAVEQAEILRELGEFQGRNMSLLNERCEEIMEKVNAVSGGNMKDLVRKTYAEAAKTSSEAIISTIGKKIDSLPKAKAIADMEMKMTKDIQRVIESKDKEDRAVNVLVHNVTESEEENEDDQKSEDIDKFKEIARALGVEQVEVQKIARLRRKTVTGEKEAGKEENEKQKPRIMLLKLTSSDHVSMLYNRRFNLKSKGFSNIYITRDLPPQEREVQRRLREELREKGKTTHIIYRGKVVERRTKEVQ